MKNTINTVTWDHLISTFCTSGGPTTRERTFREFKAAHHAAPTASNRLNRLA